MSIQVIQGQMTGIVVDGSKNFNFSIELPAGTDASQVVLAMVYSRTVATKVALVNAASQQNSYPWINTDTVQFQGSTNLVSTTTDDLEIVVVTSDEGSHRQYGGRILQ